MTEDKGETCWPIVWTANRVIWRGIAQSGHATWSIWSREAKHALSISLIQLTSGYTRGKTCAHAFFGMLWKQNGHWLNFTLSLMRVKKDKHELFWTLSTRNQKGRHLLEPVMELITENKQPNVFISGYMEHIFMCASTIAYHRQNTNATACYTLLYKYTGTFCNTHFQYSNRTAGKLNKNVKWKPNNQI